MIGLQATNQIKRNQIDEIYIIRALAILAVLIVHVSATGLVLIDKASQYYVLYNMFNIGFRFGTPTFILLSSFVIFYNYYHRKMDFGLVKHFYSRRLLYILIPYAVFTLGFYAYKVYHYYPFPGWAGFFDTYLHQLLTGTAHAHLYFVYVSVQFYLIFPLFLWLVQRFRGLAPHLLWIGFVLQWAFIFYNQHYLQYTNKGTLAISYMSFYCVGAFMGIYYEKIVGYLQMSWAKWKQVGQIFHSNPAALDRSNTFKLIGSWLLQKWLHVQYVFVWILLWTGWLVSMSGHVWIWHQGRVHNSWYSSNTYELWWNLHTIFTAIILFQVAYLFYKKLAPFIVNILVHLGMASFGVYLVHPFILIEVERLISTNNAMLLHLIIVGTFIGMLVISWLLVTIVLNIKGGWMIFGSKPRSLPYKKRQKREPMTARDVTNAT